VRHTKTKKENGRFQQLLFPILKHVSDVSYEYDKVKVKVNLSLGQTKYIALKTYPLLNQAPHREDVLES
jgi:hypothetical protein